MEGRKYYDRLCCVTKEGTYFLTASNNCGSLTDSVTISLGLCDLIMPDAFTPNNDGLNDVFRVKNPFSVQSLLLRIYDRFGEMVFESKDIRKGWDGTYKGVPAPAGSLCVDHKFGERRRKT